MLHLIKNKFLTIFLLFLQLVVFSALNILFEGEGLVRIGPLKIFEPRKTQGGHQRIFLDLSYDFRTEEKMLKGGPKATYFDSDDSGPNKTIEPSKSMALNITLCNTIEYGTSLILLSILMIIND
jgi:hypothetical protein